MYFSKISSVSKHCPSALMIMGTPTQNLLLQASPPESWGGGMIGVLKFDGSFPSGAPLSVFKLAPGAVLHAPRSPCPLFRPTRHRLRTDALRTGIRLFTVTDPRSHHKL